MSWLMCTNIILSSGPDVKNRPPPKVDLIPPYDSDHGDNDIHTRVSDPSSTVIKRAPNVHTLARKVSATAPSNSESWKNAFGDTLYTLSYMGIKGPHACTDSVCNSIVKLRIVKECVWWHFFYSILHGYQTRSKRPHACIDSVGNSIIKLRIVKECVWRHFFNLNPNPFQEPPRWYLSG